MNCFEEFVKKKQEEILSKPSSPGTMLFTSGKPPLNVNEHNLWLIDGIDRTWEGLLGKWQNYVIEDAILRKDKDEDVVSKWNKYSFFKESIEHRVPALAEASGGVYRVSLIQPLETKYKNTESILSSAKNKIVESGVFQGFFKRISSLRGYDIQKKEGHRKEKFFGESNKIQSSEVTSYFLNHLEQHINDIEIFEEELGETIRNDKNQSLLIRIEEQFFYCSLFVVDNGCHTDCVERIKNENNRISDLVIGHSVTGPEKSKQQVLGAIKRKPFLFLVKEITDISLLEQQKLVLEYIYRSCIGSQYGINHERLKYFSVSPGAHCGCGPEGLVVMRLVDVSNASQEMGFISPPFTSKFTKTNDQLWGGSVWVLWLITLFQKIEIEKCASKASAMKKNDYPNLVAAKTDQDQIRYLENVWMYNEMSWQTDLELAYENFQDVYNIGNLWKDVQEQTTMLAEWIRAEEQEKTRNAVNALTFLAVPLTVLVGILAIDPTVLDDWSDPSRAEKYLFSFGITVLSGFGLFLMGLVVVIFQQFLPKFYERHSLVFKWFKVCIAVALVVVMMVTCFNVLSTCLNFIPEKQKQTLIIISQ